MGDFKKKWKKLIFMYNIIDIIAVLVFYPFIPKLLNYPPDSINNAFQVEINGLTYTQQYISILLLCILVENLILFLTRRKLGKLLLDDTTTTTKKYVAVTRIIEATPKIIYLLQIIAPVVSITCTFLILKGSWDVILRVCLVFLTMLLSVATLSYVFCKGLFKDILIEIFNKNDKDNNVKSEILNELKRHSIKVSVVFIVIPLLLITSVLITFICYSTSIVTNGENIYEIYARELDERISSQYNYIPELENSLNAIKKYNENDGYFVIAMDGERVGGNIEFSDFFVKYITDVAMKKGTNKTYEFYATDYEGIFKTVIVNNQQVVAGIKYTISTPDMIQSVIIVSILLVLISIGLLLYSLNYIFRDITLVTKRLNNMAKAKDADLGNRIPISSNDEINDLIKSFTAVQERTNNYIEQIHEGQDLLVERERLASLGQMIGGIAHNLKTPIMSIAGAAEGLTDLIKEYDSSIEDPEVNAQDHHDIAKDMQNWVDKVKDYTSYMSDVITAVKGQAVALSDEQATDFNVEELVKRVNILMRHELKNALVTLNVNMNVDSNTTLDGNINSLVQVINNMISNAIQCYNGQPDNSIDMNFTREGNELIIEIRDYGPGLPKEVKDKLFKEMITTKGKNGTGLRTIYVILKYSCAF